MQQDKSIDYPSNNLSNALANSKFRALAWTVYLTGILYYCFAYLLRVYPSIMQLNLETHFHINATAFGLLATGYYFVYAPAQLIVGPALDRYGPRKSILFACTVSVLGTLLFTVSNIFALAFAGRLLIGLGSAFAYITALKLAITWLPRRYFAAATGAVTGCGMIVAFTTNKYLTELVQTAGYRTAMYFCFTVGVAILLAIFLVVKDKPDSAQNNEAKTESAQLSFAQLGNYLVSIIKKPQMWVIGMVGTLVYLPASVFSDTWGIQYLENVYNFTPEQASTAILFMMMGWTCSSFAAGALSDIFCTRKIPLVIAGFSATIICCLLFYVSVPTSVVYLLLFMLGICCGPHPLCFTLSKESNAPEMAGTTMAFTNFVIMMGGVIFQPVVGKLLDYSWHGAAANGLRLYSSYDYTFALSIIPVGLLIGALLTLLIKETYHNNAENKEPASAADRAFG